MLELIRQQNGMHRRFNRGLAQVNADLLVKLDIAVHNKIDTGHARQNVENLLQLSIAKIQGDLSFCSLRQGGLRRHTRRGSRLKNFCVGTSAVVGWRLPQERRQLRARQIPFAAVDQGADFIQRDRLLLLAPNQIEHLASARCALRFAFEHAPKDLLGGIETPEA